MDGDLFWMGNVNFIYEYSLIIDVICQRDNLFGIFIIGDFFYAGH